MMKSLNLLENSLNGGTLILKIKVPQFYIFFAIDMALIFSS